MRLRWRGLTTCATLTLFGCSDPRVTATDASVEATSPDGAGTSDVARDAAEALDRPRVGPPTWWRDVAPLMLQRCTECHIANGIAPFALTEFSDARTHIEEIVTETGAQRMPPWPPSSDCLPLQNPRSLSPAQIELLRQWRDADTPEGDRRDFVRPPDATEPLPATPDAVLQPDAPYTPPPGSIDDYRCFIVDPHWTTTHDMVRARIIPGEARTVHHLNMFEVRPSGLAQLEALDARDPGPGYSCYGGIGIPVGSIQQQNIQYVAGWAPGSPPLHTPANTGIRLEAGSRYVLQVHYNQLTHRNLPDRTRVEMYFSPTPPRRIALVVPIEAQRFRIPAGMADVPVEASMTPRALGIGFPVTFYGAFPHMHGFGRAVRSEVIRAEGGAHDCLIDIPRWSFHWQGFYMFDQPTRIEPDDRVRIECRYDNSAANQPVVDGVQRPPQEVRAGNGTLDEMCMNFFYLTIL